MAPTPVKAHGQMHLVYELHVTNLQASSLTLSRIEVFDQHAGAAPLARYQDADLARLLGASPAADPTDKRVISGGRRVVVYLWLTVGTADAVPVSLRHRLFFTTMDATGGEQVLEGAQVSVRNEPPLVVGPPLRGGNWVAHAGPSNSSHHRLALYPMGGRVRVPHRFAIDWIKLGDDRKAWRDDSWKNEHWYGYGEEVLAIADGMIAEVKDGIPENVPLADMRAVPMTLETIAGNYVILDLGGGHFAFFAHLQPQSIRVKVGERVHRGQVLGLLGNSGYSDAPHLHFHISTANALLGGEGVPFVIEAFEVLGVMTPDGAWQPRAVPEKLQNEMPLADTVIRFP